MAEPVIGSIEEIFEKIPSKSIIPANISEEKAKKTLHSLMKCEKFIAFNVKKIKNSKI